MSEFVSLTQKETDFCRSIAERCVFIFGFARSHTTITQQVLNTHRDVYLLGEANFFFTSPGNNFTEDYNDKHLNLFGNQVTKNTYAPRFLTQNEHNFCNWLEDAADHYPILGDKVAMSSHALAAYRPDRITAFYERNFFRARYIFLIRDPFKTLMSTIRLFDIEDNEERIDLECRAWFRYIQFWADFIRIFPNTLTLAGDDFTADRVEKISSFLDLDLGDAASLISPKATRAHDVSRLPATIEKYQDALMEIFDLCGKAAQQNKAAYQAVQKQQLSQNRGDGTQAGTTAIDSQPIGDAWAIAAQVLERNPI